MKKAGSKTSVRKGDLPSKTCAACGRPFSWRKKWEAVWENVKYCSERCRRYGKAASAVLPKSGGSAG